MKIPLELIIQELKKIPTIPEMSYNKQVLALYEMFVIEGCDRPLGFQYSDDSYAMDAFLAIKLKVYFLLIYICNFHVLNHLLLIYICKLHWNLLRYLYIRYIFF